MNESTDWKERPIDRRTLATTCMAVAHLRRRTAFPNAFRFLIFISE